MPERTYRACNLCEALCGLEIEHEGSRILAIRPDRDDVLSRGHICPKAVALQDLQDDPDRVRRPLRRSGLTLRKLKAAPHGIDLGPLEPALPDLLDTPDRRVHLAPAELLADAVRLERQLGAAAPQGLVLIGRRDLRSNNSWMHNFSRRLKGPPRCTLLIHPADAAARGIADGQKVAVTSRVGTIQAVAEISDEVMAGVVSLPHGWGHDRPGTRLSVAATAPGVSANDLTDGALVDELCGTAAVNGVPVSVSAAAADG